MVVFVMCGGASDCYHLTQIVVSVTYGGISAYHHPHIVVSTVYYVWMNEPLFMATPMLIKDAPLIGIRTFFPEHTQVKEGDDGDTFGSCNTEKRSTEHTKKQVTDIQYLAVHALPNLIFTESCMCHLRGLADS